MTLEPDKISLRSLALQRRLAIPAEQAMEAAQRLAQHVLRLPELKHAEQIAGFMPIKGEVNTLPLLEQLIQRNQTCLLPVAEAGNPVLQFYPWKPGDPLERGAFNIPIPANRIQAARPDVLLVPMLGFDKQGHRLGYGSGYYDNTIATLEAEGELVTIGIAYAIQELEKIPIEKHDKKLDMVATEAGIKDFRE